MSFFSNLFFNNRASGETEVLNAGLDMAMEFGENFRQPIQQRLAKKFKSLRPEQLDHYQSECSTAMHAGNNFVNEVLEKLCAAHQKIREAELKKQLSAFMTSRYPWINKNNLDRLYSQSCYYAFRNGYDSAIQS